MSFSLIFFGILAVSTSVLGQSARIVDGNVVDTLRRFPHHVTINVYNFNQNISQIRQCSGSIIASNWILTSIRCVFEGEWFDVIFHRINRAKTTDSFVVSVPDSAVFRYPTEYDDLALIKLPMSISDTPEVKAIKLYSSDIELKRSFVVMPGFAEFGGDQLTYGMFSLISKRSCKNTYGSLFDEYLQICTMGWNNNGQVPCQGNEGGGLVTGWPLEPRLVGVFSTPLNCLSGIPAIYMNIIKYAAWIQDVTQLSDELLF